MSQILLVDDETVITGFLRRGLAYKGYDVRIAETAETALDSARDFPPDLVILDIGLPDLDGHEVCRRLRAGGDSDLPIIMLTAKDSVQDKIAGLDNGADDYLTKPFVFDELVARVRAALRRREATARPATNLEVGNLRLDLAARQVWRAGQLIELTTREYELLELLMRHKGQVLTKEILFERVWGYDNEAGFEVIKVYINYLRSKLKLTDQPEIIHTVRGVGYMLKL
jgi:two-component system, OmpR family, response regulator MprA